MPAGGTILHTLTRIFAEHADRTAIEEWPDGRRLTYAQLDAASAALASRLAHTAGVGPGSLVPIIMPRCADYLVAVVAILRCGAAYAPIDPSAPRREAMLEPLRSPVVIGREPGMLDPAREVEPGEAPSAHVHADSPAYVMYTSGTTGVPKGVVVPHRAVVRLVVDADFARFGPEHRWGVMSAVAFDASTLEIWGALLHGGCCVVQTLPMPSLDDLASYLSKGRISDTWLTASLFNAMVDEHPRSMAHMDQLLTGGERESVQHVRAFKQHCPHVSLIHGYGPTENTTFSLCHAITKHDAEGDRIPIGTPIHGSTMRLVQPGGPPDAAGTPLREGELLVGGLGLALGYLNDDAKTAEKFVTDSTGERWYRTGDLVRLRDDGAAVFIGRVDRQVKIRGHRIEPDGVESELARCRGVSQGVVVVTGDTAETRRMVAFFVPAGASAAEVRLQLADRLPPTMMPERFVAVASMPIGPTGKVDRQALLAHLGSTDAEAPPTASPTELQLIGLFSTRLGHMIGPTDRFQDAGGHSLLAMRLSADIRRELGVSLPAAEILRRQTIRSIAGLVETLPQASDTGAAEPTDPIGDIRRRASLEHSRDATGKAMLVHHAWHVTPAIAVDTLKEAWLTLLERHEALRTSIRFTDNGPQLVEHAPRSASVFHAEHDRLGAPDGGDARVRAAAEGTIGPMDPPARMHAWDVADGSQVVLMVFHHAVIDEWSLELIAQDLHAILNGDPLPDAIPYSTFVRAEHAMRDEGLASGLARRIAAGPDASRDLPPSGPQPGVNFCLDPNAISQAQLDARAGSLGVGPAALVAAALSLALQERFGPPARWVMTPFARRGSEALQHVVGCCLDMRLLEARGDTLESVASHIHEQMLEAQGDRVLPLEALIDAVRRADPQRAGDTTRFGMTYRRINDAPMPLGGSTANPLDIEQPAARFGLCLHVERRSEGIRIWLEAARSYFSQSDLRSIGEHVVDLVLARATRPSSPAPTGTSTAQEGGDTASAQELHELSGLWQELLGTRPQAASNFFMDGGSSLMAMRLAAAVHKRLGRRLMLNQFLRKPTFEGLAQSIRDDVEHPFAEFSTSAEPRSDSPWCIAIPGSAGRAIDYHMLWHKLGDDARDMLAFDLSTIAAGEAATFDPRRFFARFTALAHAHVMASGRTGPIAIMGYSLGGLVALDMAAKLTALGHTVEHIILLDAYSPSYLSRTPTWYLSKINARLRNLGQPRNTTTPRKAEHESVDAHAAEASRATWRGIHASLSGWPLPRAGVPVTLVRSAPAWRHVRPVWHARTNGLGPLLGADVDVRVIDIEHLAMLTTGAGTVAGTIRDLVTRRATTPSARASQPSPIARHAD